MNRLERFIIFWALGYMAVYVVLIVLGFAALDLGQRIQKSDGMFATLLFFHFLAMVQNFLALVLTIRDLYLRSFPRENQKLTWLLLILYTGGIGWLVYVFKYAIKPRESR